MAAHPMIRIPAMRPAAGIGARAGTIDELAEFLRRHRRVLVLTGAGLSTNSGIPAYRDGDGQWLRRDPILYQQFVASADMRRRYWARSYFGWQLMRQAKPNAAHRMLAALEQAGRLSALVTQNVDGLHAAAGSRSVIELHGRLSAVSCMDCKGALGRDQLQDELARRNPDWHPEVLGFNPDGDAELDASAYPGFRVVDCSGCGGALKPDVVFFGEAVPAERVRAVDQALQASDAVLVVGSSLVVMSGYRIVRSAVARGLPVAAINRGRTRADELLAFKLDGDCVTTLAALQTDLD